MKAGKAAVRPTWRRRIVALSLGVLGLLITIEVTSAIAYQLFVSRQHTANAGAIENTDDEVRILCVGESTTAVAGDESGTLLVPRTSYPAQLEATLSERAPQIPWRVLNGGIMGGTSSAVLTRLETDLNTLKPHIIIAMMGIKDTPAEWTPFGIPIPSALLRLHAVRLAIWLLEDVKLEASPRPVDVHSFDDLPAWAKERYKHVGNHVMELRTLENRTALDTLKVGVYALHMGYVEHAEQRVRAVVNQYDVGYVLLARILAAAGRHTEAAELLVQASRKHPSEGLYRVALADLFWRQGEMDAAHQVLDMLAQTPYPDVVQFEATLTRAETFLAQDKPHAALQALVGEVPERTEQEVEVLPNLKVRLLTTRGRAQLATKDWVQAEASLLSALDKKPDRQASMFLLAQVYRETGRLDLEAEVRQKLLSHSGRVAEYFELAKLMRLSGDEDGARSVMEAAAHETPSLRENYALLYEMARRHGAQLVVMQYPGFSLEPAKIYAPDVDGVTYIDNQTVFDADPEGYFFAPTYPQSFSHYTLEGSKVLASHIADSILELPMLEGRTEAP